MTSITNPVARVRAAVEQLQEAADQHWDRPHMDRAITEADDAVQALEASYGNGVMLDRYDRARIVAAIGTLIDLDEKLARALDQEPQLTSHVPALKELEARLDGS